MTSANLPSGNGARRPPRRASVPLSRRSRLIVGALVALVFAVVLVAPILPIGGSTKPCALTLLYGGRAYVARAVAGGNVTQKIAIGVGVASGCGTTPSNVSLRSIDRVSPSIAVGVGADASSLYVRRGVCGSASPKTLMACLRRNR
ncbi:MAG: hypothetical protein QOI27_3211 [Gaiellaceae bacterium]|jgi:hypothetical protein|nr:hypothetical protein [Gaiellaceae bacterium]MDX6468655.1 hypothetical protein [Gaiellaceae bacterium]